MTHALQKFPKRMRTQLAACALASALPSCATSPTPAPNPPAVLAPNRPGGASLPSAPAPPEVPRIDVCGQSVPVNALGFECHQLDFEDLNALAKLEGLERLDLSQSGVTDLRPLSAHPALQRLDLESTDVTDLAPLAQLPELRRLRLVYRTSMATGQPKVLTALNRPTPSLDLSPLGGLRRLERLVLGFVAVQSLAPIRAASGLRRLGLLSVEAPPGALAELQGLTQLEQVVLFNAPCRELSALAASTQMTTLFVHPCRRADLRPLAGLTGLRRLTLSAVEGRGARGLSALTRVESLDVSGARLDDYSFIASMAALQSLDVSESTVTNLAPLARLAKLRELDAAGIKIDSLDALANLKNLRSLALTGEGGHAFHAPKQPAKKLDTAVRRLRNKRPELTIQFRDPTATTLVRTPAIFDD